MKMLRRFVGAIKGAATLLFAFLLFPFARLFLWHKKIWIISEYGYEARDNGYVFFEYMRKKHPEINCYYAIDFQSSDYDKIKVLGNAIRFGSFKHFAYFCAARFLVSSKTQGFCPSYYLTLLRTKMHLWGKYVYLQHGITYNHQAILYKKNAKLDLIICGAKPEYDDILNKYGYKENEVAYTGFARFDLYHDINPSKAILAMPTWRRYDNNDVFVETPFFKMWQELLVSKKLNNLLVENGYKMYFYLHPEFKDKFDAFSSDCSNIALLRFEGNDLQKYIRDSAIFITDFSSLAFDFGYMERPVIYYHRDKDFFYTKHYKKGYFEYDRDGFGPVCDSVDSILEKLSLIFRGGNDNEIFYKNNSKRFFPIKDNLNCERIFKTIAEMK